MDSTGQILNSLDRLREGQLMAQATTHQHGDLLHELVNLQKELVALQRETVRANINRDKEFSLPDKSPFSLLKNAPATAQWMMAIVMVAMVVHGEKPETILKLLASFFGN